jgi:hypothetical protein
MEKRPAGKDRRRNIRTWMNRPGRIRIGGGAQSYMQLVDLSPEGAAMYCNKALEPDTRVEVQFHLNLNPEKVELTLRGRVDHSYARGDSHLVRILFVEPTLQALETIAEFVKLKTRPA